MNRPRLDPMTSFDSSTSNPNFYKIGKPWLPIHETELHYAKHAVNMVVDRVRLRDGLKAWSGPAHSTAENFKIEPKPGLSPHVVVLDRAIMPKHNFTKFSAIYRVVPSYPRLCVRIKPYFFVPGPGRISCWAELGLRPTTPSYVMVVVRQRRWSMEDVIS